MISTFIVTSVEHFLWLFTDADYLFVVIGFCHLLSQTQNLWSQCVFCISFHIYYMKFISSLADSNTHTWQNQMAINSGRPAHNDFTCQVWFCCVELHTVQCNGHREFQVSSDKWPRLAVDQETWGLSDLSLHQQTLLQQLDLSAGYYTFTVFFSFAHTVILFSFSFSLVLATPNWSNSSYVI